MPKKAGNVSKSLQFGQMYISELFVIESVHLAKLSIGG